MSAFDRRIQILKKLICYNTVKRTELASEFNVSDDTIGRDLRALGRYLSVDELALLERLEKEMIGQDKCILQRIIQKFTYPKDEEFI